MLNFAYAPNKLSVEDTTTTDTNWRVIATDGTAYTTLALLAAANKYVFPYGADPSHNYLSRGMFPQSVLIRSIASDGVSDGSPFYADWNDATAPTDGIASTFVSGSGQQIALPGGTYWNIWIRKTVPTDLIKITLFY